MVTSCSAAGTTLANRKHHPSKVSTLTAANAASKLAKCKTNTPNVRDTKRKKQRLPKVSSRGKKKSPALTQRKQSQPKPDINPVTGMKHDPTHELSGDIDQRDGSRKQRYNYSNQLIYTRQLDTDRKRLAKQLPTMFRP